MAIIRSPRPDSNFYILPKAIGENNFLSWQATALLIFLLCKPDNWKISVEHIRRYKISSDFPIGRDSVYKMINELAKYGFIEKKQGISEDGRFAETDYIVYDVPHTGFQEAEPVTSLPEADSPYTVKPTLIRIHNKQEYNITSAHPADAVSVDNSLTQRVNANNTQQDGVIKGLLTNGNTILGINGGLMAPQYQKLAVLNSVSGEITETAYNVYYGDINHSTIKTQANLTENSEKNPAKKSPKNNSQNHEKNKNEIKIKLSLDDLLKKFPDLSRVVGMTWFSVRKDKRAASLTELALETIEKEAAKAGITTEQAITMAASNGWVGFKASWLGSVANKATLMPIVDKPWHETSSGIVKKGEELKVFWQPEEQFYQFKARVYAAAGYKPPDGAMKTAGELLHHAQPKGVQGNARV